MLSGEMILNMTLNMSLSSHGFLFITVRPVNHLKRPLDIYTFEDGTKRYQMVWEELVSKHAAAELQKTTFSEGFSSQTLTQTDSTCRQNVVNPFV